MRAMIAKHTHTTSDTRPKKTKREINQRAAEICGTLSKPSKMPCHGFSLPAQRCKTGGKLQSDPNSTCFKCYALSGNYRRGNVRDALEARYQKLMHAHTTQTLDVWAEAMAAQINANETSPFFRWHDSGDVQSTAHVLAIFDVCDRTPLFTHWLPTREMRFIREALEKRPKPRNLVIRLSSLRREFPPQAGLAKRLGIQTSTVSWTGSAHTCPAGKQGNVCGACRACWKPEIENVDYPLH